MRAGRKRETDQHFRVVEFINQSGSLSYRVTGFLHGKRLRENFPRIEHARTRAAELEAQATGRTDDALHPMQTWLSSQELRECERLVNEVAGVETLSIAVKFWRDQGSLMTSRHAPRLDEAAKQFVAWMRNGSALRKASVAGLSSRITRFTSSAGNIPLGRLSPEFVEEQIVKMGGGFRNQNNNRLALSRFCSWCAERKRRWISENPVQHVEVRKIEHKEPEIYDLDDVARWLAGARRYKEGFFLSYIVLQFFGGLRPFEVARLNADQWNLEDAELRIEAHQSKKKRPRTIKLSPVLIAWLRICPSGKPVNPQKRHDQWEEFKRLVRPKRLISDGFRHTAISHYFRLSGSYGLTAEWSHNSEKVIKDHYQGRTTSAETARYWALFPETVAEIH